MANNPSGQLSKLEQHKSSPGPDLTGHKDKDLGGVKGNNPHHNTVRSRDSYSSKSDESLNITVAK